MRPLLAAWLLPARIRRRVFGGQGSIPAYEELIEFYARERSFVDVGTMWNVHGRYAFAAEAAGARSVTAFDGMEPTAEFDAERTRLSSSVRYVRGDIHSLESVEEIGMHDVVWCTGLVYHSPDPVAAIRNL